MKIRASWAAVASHELALFRFVLDRHEAVDAHDEARGEGSRAELAEAVVLRQGHVAPIVVAADAVDASAETDPDADVDPEDRVVEDLGCCAGQ